MRSVLLGVLLAAPLCGCGESSRLEPSRILRSDSATIRSESPTSNPSEVGTVYPEKADVERLLHQARELESQGRFETALSVVNQALQFDGHSPAATTLRNRLEEIIRRI